MVLCFIIKGESCEIVRHELSMFLGDTALKQNPPCYQKYPDLIPWDRVTSQSCIPKSL